MAFKCAFTIESDTRYLTPLREWLGSVQRLLGGDAFPKDAVLPCQMALVEAVDNAIFHAHNCKRDLPIDISLTLQDGAIVMEVVDRGRGVGDPKLPEPDELVDHGRGLFIIKQVMSRVESRIVDGSHHMRMEYAI